jgi:diguanylate cyclase (GGDEF)-like protein/PAS domain S-box-containing protein
MLDQRPAPPDPNHETTLAALRTSEARFRAVFDHAAVGIVLINLDGTIFDSNLAFAKFLGYDPTKLRGHLFHNFAPSEDAGEYAQQFDELVHGTSEQLIEEHRYVRRDGQVVWASVTMSVANAGVESASVIAVIQDITTRKSLDARLTHQAFHDSLTNLANRSLFRQRVEQALARAARRDHVAVMFLDLDNFKSVNDSLGHARGDELLTIVANRLLNATRGSDTVARLGGDEFGILLSNVRDHEQTRVVAERIMNAMREPISLHDDKTVAGVSIGIAWAQSDDDGAEELLRNADVAMYTAKAQGKGSYAFFIPEMYNAVVDRLALEADLRRALANNELMLFYQPLVRLTDGSAVGVESLVRWQHPTRGVLEPADFIPVAEETGLIIPLGRWVLREACAQAQQWSLSVPALGPLSVSVNVSGRQLQDATFIGDVRDALKTSEIDPARVILEITETVIMHRTESVLQQLHQLKALGVRLAIDDFGTGYSSLSYLQQFPIDILKIDKAFIDSLDMNTSGAALTRTIIGLSGTLGLSTIAEGIERTQQRSMLHELGCHLGQGFLFAYPLSAAETGEALKSLMEGKKPGDHRAA